MRKNSKQWLYFSLSNFFILPAFSNAVYDHANYVQNYESVQRLIRIADVMERELDHLESLEDNKMQASLDAYQRILDQLDQALVLSTQFDAVYVDPRLQSDYLQNADSISMQNGWNTTSNESLYLTSENSANVVSDLESQRQSLQGILNDSQQAVGSLEVSQAGNQMNALMTVQLMNANAQLAALNQSEADQILQENNDEKLAEKQKEDNSKDWAKPSDVEPDERYFPVLQ